MDPIEGTFSDGQNCWTIKRLLEAANDEPIEHVSTVDLALMETMGDWNVACSAGALATEVRRVLNADPKEAGGAD